MTPEGAAASRCSCRAGQPKVVGGEREWGLPWTGPQHRGPPHAYGACRKALLSVMTTRYHLHFPHLLLVMDNPLYIRPTIWREETSLPIASMQGKSEHRMEAARAGPSNPMLSHQTPRYSFLSFYVPRQETR
jgi:hypothetical protein